VVRAGDLFPHPPVGSSSKSRATGLLVHPRAKAIDRGSVGAIFLIMRGGQGELAGDEPAASLRPVDAPQPLSERSWRRRCRRLTHAG
jgi:hypothetical protein